MQITEWQKQVDDWISKYGKRYFDPMTNTALMTEETGEVARLMARLYGEQSFKDKEDEKNASARLGEEIADLLFVITCIANQCNIDMQSVLLATLEKKTKRDLTRHRKNRKLD